MKLLLHAVFVDAISRPLVNIFCAVKLTLRGFVCTHKLQSCPCPQPRGFPLVLQSAAGLCCLYRNVLNRLLKDLRFGSVVVSTVLVVVDMTRQQVCFSRANKACLPNQTSPVLYLDISCALGTTSVETYGQRLVYCNSVHNVQLQMVVYVSQFSNDSRKLLHFLFYKITPNI